MVILKVPGIMCDDCRQKILAALKEAGIAADVNIRLKVVTVAAEDAEKATAVIQKVGYEVQR